MYYDRAPGSGLGSPGLWEARVSRSLFDRRVDSQYSDEPEGFLSAQVSLTSLMMQQEATNSRRMYRTMIIIMVIGFLYLTILVFFVTFLAWSKDSLSGVSLPGVTIGLFTVGVPALLASVSLWVIGKRWPENKQLTVRHDLARLRAGLTEAIRFLTSDEAATQISALYQLEVAARVSEKDARLIVRAVEDLIRRSVPRADVKEFEATHNNSEQVRAEVQVGLELLGRLPKFVRTSANGLIRYRLNRLDLRGYNFQGLDFSAANLKSTNLSRCVVSGARFEGADLRNADLSQIVGETASFRRSLMERVSLNEAFVIGADFTGALLTHADFRCAVLVDSRFDRTILVDCDMRNADLRGASFAGARIRDVSFATAQVDEDSPLQLVSPFFEINDQTESPDGYRGSNKDRHPE